MVRSGRVSQQLHGFAGLSLAAERLVDISRGTQGQDFIARGGKRRVGGHPLQDFVVFKRVKSFIVHMGHVRGGVYHTAGDRGGVVPENECNAAREHRITLVFGFPFEGRRGATQQSCVRMMREIEHSSIRG